MTKLSIPVSPNLRVRALFISDLHLGSSHSQAREVLRFLRSVNPEYLYLVGDIIDGWRLKRRWYWEPAYDEILELLANLSSRGVRICYTPGNHDDFLRKQPLLKRIIASCGIDIREEFVHRTEDGRRFLVTHGDRFDDLECHASFISRIGACGYNLLLSLDRRLHRLVSGDRTCRYRISGIAKRKIKRAITHVCRFEDRILQHARSQECRGVICGHVHTPKISVSAGMTYCNTGDWVENCSAVLEDAEGRLRLVCRDRHGSLRLASIEGYSAAAHHACTDLQH